MLPLSQGTLYLLSRIPKAFLCKLGYVKRMGFLTPVFLRGARVDLPPVRLGQDFPVLVQIPPVRVLRGWPWLWVADANWRLLLNKFYVHLVSDFYHDVWAQMWDPGPRSSEDRLAGVGGDFVCWPLAVAFASTTSFLVLHRLCAALWAVYTPMVSLDASSMRRPASLLGLADRMPDILHPDTLGAEAGGSSYQCPSQRRLLRWLWRRLRSQAVAFEAAWVALGQGDLLACFGRRGWHPVASGCLQLAL